MEFLSAVLTHPITLVGVGSAVGGNLRYWIGRWVKIQPWAGDFPWATFAINVSGSFFLGFFAVWLYERIASERPELYLLLGVGFCGGYTTFSSFEWETFALIREDRWFEASGYIVGSVLVGFVGLLLGVGLARFFFSE